MNFRIFKSNGQEVIINTDRIISVRFNSENGKTLVSCTDQFTIEVDDTEDELKKKLGTKRPGDGRVGFKPA